MRYFTIVLLFVLIPLFAFMELPKIIEYKCLHSIDYVKEKYEVTIHGIDCLFYPARNPKRLWVLFNGATVNRYTMWSWFWREDEAWEDTAFLFLKDDQIRWYFGTQDKPLTQTYCDITRQVMQQCNLSNNQVFTIGHSMGGYAAIYFGLQLQVKGIFALRPQIDWQNAVQFFSVKKLRDVWVDLDQLIKQSVHLPLFFLQFGEFGPDKDAGLQFVDALLKKNTLFFVQKMDNLLHTGYRPDKKFIEQMLYFMEQITTNC